MTYSAIISRQVSTNVGDPDQPSAASVVYDIDSVVGFGDTGLFVFQVVQPGSFVRYSHVAQPAELGQLVNTVPSPLTENYRSDNVTIVADNALLLSDYIVNIEQAIQDLCDTMEQATTYNGATLITVVNT